MPHDGVLHKPGVPGSDEFVPTQNFTIISIQNIILCKCIDVWRTGTSLCHIPSQERFINQWILSYAPRSERIWKLLALTAAVVGWVPSALCLFNGFMLKLLCKGQEITINKCLFPDRYREYPTTHQFYALELMHYMEHKVYKLRKLTHWNICNCFGSIRKSHHVNMRMYERATVGNIFDIV